MAAIRDPLVGLPIDIQLLPAEKGILSASIAAIHSNHAQGEQRPRLQTFAPDVKLWNRCTDLARLALTRLRVDTGGTIEHPTPRKDRPLSEKGLFAYRYVDPLFSWWGRNSRTLASASLGVVEVYNEAGRTLTLVNGASHNYCAWYRQTTESAAIHHLCLDSLPVVSLFDRDENRSSLHLAMHQAIAEFFRADFCFTTSTGYGSNYFALPAILQGSRVAILADSHCHNSMFTGCFLSPSTTLLKFKHNNMKHLELLLRQESWAFDRVVVAVEGLYSMEGDIPPLADLASLKQRYGFVLYCDEAHSFLTLGKTGRGCLEMWNDRSSGNPLPWDLIDIRSATLSKSVGGIGGVVVGKAEFAQAVEDRFLQDQMHEPTAVPTSTIVQTLWVLGQSTQTRANLHHLSDMAVYIRKTLQASGVYVYGDPDTPIIPVWAGGPSAAARLSYEMRKAGLLATPVSTPAVPFWESRVRINLSADYCADDVNRLVAAVVKAVAKCGIQRLYEGTGFYEKFVKERVQHAGHAESAAAVTKIENLMHDSIRQRQGRSDLAYQVSQIAHQSQFTFGIGSGSARWISGTFPSHLAVEDLVAQRTGLESAMTYPDGAVGLASTVAALMRPLTGARRHYLLAPYKTDPFVHDGLLLGSSAKSKNTNVVNSYHSLDGIADTLRLCQRKADKSATNCYTLYLCVHDDEHGRKRCPSQCPGVQLSQVPTVLKEICELSKSLQSTLTVVVHLASKLINLQSPTFNFFKAQKTTHLLLYGSFMEFYQLPGSFLAGPRQLIQELRYSSRGYMYTTSSPPFIMDLVKSELEEQVQ